jgi:hypothetical protein
MVRPAHEMRNEFSLSSDVACEPPSRFSCVHQAEGVLIVSYKKVSALHWPLETLETHVHLVAHLVGPVKG